MKKDTLHNRACKTLGIDSGLIRRVEPKEFKEITGYGVSNYLGMASSQHKVYYVRRGEPLRTYIHEILHILFKSRPHWWIYAVSWKLSGITSNMVMRKRYGYGGGSFVDTWRIKDLPSKKKLIELCVKASKRLEDK